MKFDFVGRKHYWFIFSALIIVTGLTAFFIKGFSYGIEFRGGVLFDVTVEKPVTVESVRATLKPLGLAESIIQLAGGREVLIRTLPLDRDEQAKVVDVLKEEFGIEEIRSIQSVSPAWGRQITRAAVIALLLSLVGILVYVSFRFEFKMAVSAIVALLHDLLIVAGVYALAGRELTPATVAAVLTILGYSLYDTIVIFHRIMENSKNLAKTTYSQMVNSSINQVLMRSINTSLTSTLPVFCLLLFGGETLKDFAFALVVGLISSTYSSIFIASPVLSMWKETEPFYRNLRRKYANIN
jgi:SecD/SecF fusion protein